MMPRVIHGRQRRLWIALKIEVLSLAWTLIEAGASVMAASATGSLSLTVFGLDSGIELISGLVLAIRIWLEYQAGDADVGFSRRVERVASFVVGVCLLALAAGIAWKSGQALALHRAVRHSTLGMWIAVLASVISPWLARFKWRLGVQLQSQALMGDAACTMTCAYMAWALLAGLLANAWFGAWWVDPAAALAILYFVVKEALESIESARTGHDHVHQHGELTIR